MRVWGKSLVKPFKLDPQKHPEVLNQFNESGPYYTSYPTLGLWSKKFQHTEYTDALIDFFTHEGENAPIHLYVHIPFCAKLCYYCICNIQVSNDRARIQQFLDYLIREIDLLKNFFNAHGIKPNIKEIHLGGGTPSHLFNDQFAQLIQKLGTLADIDSLNELTMEIDPRTTKRENLHFFSEQGVKRISFGVQDFDPEVQRVINRVQPPELIDSLLTPEIRSRFTGVNFDLLYNLPLQTRETFRKTIEQVKKFSPERVTLLKYAHVPDIRKHMKMIKESDLPAADQLPLMFVDAVNGLLEGGYEWVGVDNFAKPSDDLGKAVQKKTVCRTFNGFTPGRTSHLIGVGPTTTSAFGNYYSQSVYGLNDYYKRIGENQFPILRGYKLNKDEIIRRDIIFRLLCKQSVDFNEIDSKYALDHKKYFSEELETLNNGFTDRGILEMAGNVMEVTFPGRFLLRNVCKVFDTFHKNKDYRVLGP